MSGSACTNGPSARLSSSGDLKSSPLVAKNALPPGCVTLRKWPLSVASACVRASVATLVSSGVGACTTTIICWERWNACSKASSRLRQPRSDGSSVSMSELMAKWRAVYAPDATVSNNPTATTRQALRMQKSMMRTMTEVSMERESSSRPTAVYGNVAPARIGAAAPYPAAADTWVSVGSALAALAAGLVV